MLKTLITRESFVEKSLFMFLLFFKIQCIIDSSFVNKDSIVNKEGE